MDIPPKPPLCIPEMTFFSAQGRSELTALSLLDLSAAFDTIDQDLLLCRSIEWFGIDGVVLQLVISYLTGRSQLVNGNGVLCNCHCAVFRKALCWVQFFLLCILLLSVQ